MTKRAALYLRVSTRDQNTANQNLALEKAANSAGWEIVAIFEDAGISGAKGREKRPAFDDLCKTVARREVDIVMAWSVDRLGRSLQDLVAFMNDLKGSGCDLFLHQQAIDTSTASGRLLFQMVAVFAEFERSMIQERVHAGLDRARAQGKHLGRPNEISPRKMKAIKAFKESGQTYRDTAKHFSVSVNTVQRAMEA